MSGGLGLYVDVEELVSGVLRPAAPHAQVLLSEVTYGNVPFHKRLGARGIGAR